MAELLNLTTPVIRPERVTDTYRILFVGLYLEPPAVVIEVLSNHSETRDLRITGTEALTLLHTLNTANFTTVSFHRRVLELVATMLPELAGTVTGTPL